MIVFNKYQFYIRQFIIVMHERIILTDS